MTSELPAALAKVRDLASAFGVSATNLSSASRQIPDFRSQLEVIEAAISAHSALGPFLGKFVIGPSGGGPIHAYSLACHLARRVLSDVSPDTAIAEVAEFIKSPRVDVQTIYCITGASVATSISLGDRITVARPEDLPNSELRQRFFSEEFYLSGSGLDMMQETPTAAIVWRWSIDPAIIEPSELLSKLAGEDQQAESAAFDRAFASIALSCTGTIQRSHRYHDVAQPGFPGMGQSWSPGLALGMRGREPSAIDVDLCMHLYRCAEVFREWDTFQRVVKRFARANLRGDRVDAHLDLGIVAESLLGHGSGESGEIRHRLANRAAWLLGSSFDERLEIVRKMKRLYDLRSSAAHEGHLPDSGSKKWTKDDISTSNELCAQLLRKTLEHGRFITEWDAITLGSS